MNNNLKMSNAFCIPKAIHSFGFALTVVASVSAATQEPQNATGLLRAAINDKADAFFSDAYPIGVGLLITTGFIIF